MKSKPTLLKAIATVGCIALSAAVFADKAQAQSAASAAPSEMVTISQSRPFVAADNQVQSFMESINLPKGESKLNLSLTYYNGTATNPGFKWIRISSSTMHYFTEKQFDGNKQCTVDVTGELTDGGNQIRIEAGGIKGSTFGWRLMAVPPRITAVQTKTIEPGETITVGGTNFSTDLANNTATFNDVPLTCISATRKNLVFKVPESVRPGNGVLKISSAGFAAGQYDMQAVNSVPVLESLSAGWVYPGSPITINGGPFGTNPRFLHVTIGAFNAPVLSATTNSITVKSPLEFLGNPFGYNQSVKVWSNNEMARNSLTVNCYQGIAPTAYSGY